METEIYQGPSQSSATESCRSLGEVQLGSRQEVREDFRASLRENHHTIHMSQLDDEIEKVVERIRHDGLFSAVDPGQASFRPMNRIKMAESLSELSRSVSDFEFFIRATSGTSRRARERISYLQSVSALIARIEESLSEEMVLRLAKSLQNAGGTPVGGHQVSRVELENLDRGLLSNVHAMRPNLNLSSHFDAVPGLPFALELSEQLQQEVEQVRKREGKKRAEEEFFTREDVSERVRGKRISNFGTVEVHDPNRFYGRKLVKLRPRYFDEDEAHHRKTRRYLVDDGV